MLMTLHAMSKLETMEKLKNIIVSSLLRYSSFVLSSGLISLIYNASRVKRCSIPRFDDANIRTSEVCNLATVHMSRCFLAGFIFWLECSLKRVIMCQLVWPT